jgi:hypothetical protein
MVLAIQDSFEAVKTDEPSAGGAETLYRRVVQAIFLAFSKASSMVPTM